MERLRQRFDTGLLRSASSQHEREFMHANIVTVSPVSGKADLKAFVDLPWSIYANDPNWVPPLKSEVYGLITPGKNPWFEHGEAQYFLRSEEHTSELQSLMRISYAVFCLKKKTNI